MKSIISLIKNKYLICYLYPSGKRKICIKNNIKKTNTNKTDIKQKCEYFGELTNFFLFKALVTYTNK